MKRITEFKEINGRWMDKANGDLLLCEAYPSVTFSELRTFDLLALYFSARIMFKRYTEWVFLNNKYFKDKLDSSEDDVKYSKYITAIRKELSKREHLSRHERKSARNFIYY